MRYSNITEVQLKRQSFTLNRYFQPVLIYIALPLLPLDYAFIIMLEHVDTILQSSFYYVFYPRGTEIYLGLDISIYSSCYRVHILKVGKKTTSSNTLAPSILIMNGIFTHWYIIDQCQDLWNCWVYLDIEMKPHLYIHYSILSS